MGKIKDTFTVLGSLGVILGVGVILILGLAGISYGFQWFWSLFSFGVAGFGLGLIIIGITTYFTILTSDGGKFSFNLNSITHLGLPSITGYVFGFATLFAAGLWFFIPETVIQNLPSFGSVFFYTLFAGFLFAGVLGCLTAAIESLGDSWFGSLFMFGVFIFGMFIINSPIWAVSERIPQNYYLIGKIVFIFILFIQILCLTFFSVIPSLQNNRRPDVEANNQPERKNS